MTVDQVFEIDEDKLAKETEWILKKWHSSKKRQADISPTVNSSLENKNKGH